MRHEASRYVRFSNRPIGVKRFQTTHHRSVDVSRGLVLLFGIGTKALPSWGSEDEVEQAMTRSCCQANSRSKRTCELTSSIVPQGTSFHRLYPHHLRDATRIVAVRLVDLCLQRGSHVSRLDTDRRQVCFGQSTQQPLRQRPGFQSNPLEAVAGVRQYRQQSIGLTRHLRFPNDPARVIHNADAGLLDRNVQSRKMLHAALLLLMFEAVHTNLVSPSA